MPKSRLVQPARRWRPGALTWAIAVFALFGVGAYLYPKAASWATQYDQSQVVSNYDLKLENLNPSIEEQLREAHEYNSELAAGAVLESNARKPTSSASSSSEFAYQDMLKVSDSGLMARIRIEKIGVDLPVYHGTDDATLERGAGHLEGSSLPVGGVGTHSVITAHRGLASARMFTDLNKIEVGDHFVIEVLGEVLTYSVRETRVVDPKDTSSLESDPTKDLVTLVTCTPLGINSHRILVTGERITPTPIEDVQNAGTPPDIPGFPWWAVGMGAAVILVGVFVWRSGFSDESARQRSLLAKSGAGLAPEPDVRDSDALGVVPPLAEDAAVLATSDQTTGLVSDGASVQEPGQASDQVSTREANAHLNPAPSPNTRPEAGPKAQSEVGPDTQPIPRVELRLGFGESSRSGI